ncbi:hypothetical protein BKG75_17300 [Mycobacteroides chelonae]|nr:hypothetical protein BKG75_17300 [Mycobacteroides chelonae]
MITLSQVRDHARTPHPGTATRRNWAKALIQAFTPDSKIKGLAHVNSTANTAAGNTASTRKLHDHRGVNTMSDAIARPQSVIQIDSHEALADLPDGTIIVWNDDLAPSSCPREAAVLYTNKAGERQIKHTREHDYYYYELDRVGLPALAIVWGDNQ